MGYCQNLYINVRKGASHGCCCKHKKTKHKIQCFCSVRRRRPTAQSAVNVPQIVIDGRPSNESDEVRCFEKQRQEHKLGIMLIAVSVMFIVCQSFKMIPDLYEVLFCSDKSIPCITTSFVKTCLNLSHLLVIEKYIIRV